MRSLSGGMKRRVMVAQALVHRPPVIVLDEPTAGVDVELRQTLWAFVRGLNAAGHTIVLTTHYLEEAQQLCSRIAMMQDGRIVALDSTARLLAAFSERVLRVKLEGCELPPALAASAPRRGRRAGGASRSRTWRTSRTRSRALREAGADGGEPRGRRARAGGGVREDHAARGRERRAHERLPHAALQGGAALLEGELPDGGGARCSRRCSTCWCSRTRSPAHVQAFPGVTYVQFLVPGLAMMAMLQNAFANSSSSLIQSKITGNIVFILLPPLAPGEIFAAYLLASMVRGLVVGIGVFAATVWLVPLPVAQPLWALAFALVGCGMLGTWASSPASGRRSSTSSPRSRTSS